MVRIILSIDVTSVGALQVKSGNFRVRDLTGVERSGSNTNYFKMQALNDNVHLLDGIVAGDKVMVECEILGRLWQSNVIMNLNILKVSKTGGVSREQDKDIFDDDLPFRL